MLPFMSASFSFLLDCRVDHFCVEEVDEILDETVRLHRLRGCCASRFALAGFQCGSTDTGRLAGAHLDEGGATEMLLQGGLEFVRIAAFGEIGFGLRYDELEGVAFSPLELCIAGEFARRPCQGELLNELRPSCCGLRRLGLRGRALRRRRR